MKKLLFTIATVVCMLVANNSFAQDDQLLASILKMVSPVEVSDMIRKQGIAYNKDILNKSTNLIKYTSPYKQALNLGVYSTDLGYATINDQSMDALAYMTSVKKVAESMKVGQFINTSRIMTLAANKDDLNKLLDETATTFENISDYLDKQKKSNLAALMLTGGWLEMLSITCEVAKTKPSADINERIISQKLILDQILDVLKPYTTDNEVKGLVAKLTELKVIFEAYKLEANNGDTIMEEKTDDKGNKVLVAVSKSSTKDINLTTEDINKILGKVREIRKSIVE
jgi:hypothetical protein